MNEPVAQTLRVALLSDTHGYVDPRIAALVARCDLAVHAGDVGGLAVLRALRPRLGRVVAVRGNNDNRREWPPADLAGLEQLPRIAELELPGGRLVVIHGDRSGPLYARHARLRRRFPGARAVIVGHSHRQVCDRDALPWVLNPGPAGRYRTYGQPGCLVLTAAPDGWEIERHALRTLGRQPRARVRRPDRPQAIESRP